MLTWIETKDGDHISAEYCCYCTRPNVWRAIRIRVKSGADLVIGGVTLAEAKLAAERHSRQMFISGEVKS